MALAVAIVAYLTTNSTNATADSANATTTDSTSLDEHFLVVIV